ncbi:MAG: aconitate hydratase AcnA [Proteobacteria bacterium]|nr:aconitate hydratase AcnA [Pseudomonadota bacterium]
MPPTSGTRNSFGTRRTLATNAGPVAYYSLNALAEGGVADVTRLPYSIKVLLEALLRGEDGHAIGRDDVAKLCHYDPQQPGEVEIPFKPARVILQDFTGVPAVVDLAAMRSAVAALGGDPTQINPQCPVDLVIDHSVQVDAYGSPSALARNAELEFERNRERYAFLRWGQQAFRNFRVIPPASGIVHQVNLEYLATCVQQGVEGDPAQGESVLYPDTVVGTDSHTTMINGLGVLGWGVGGIEAEAVMLGQPIYLLAPEVVGVRLVGALPGGVTATDLTLRLTQLLRAHGVVNKFVEFCGPGLAALALADRATIANMAPEYGATMGFFPVDDETLRYLRRTGRPATRLDQVERYCKEQGLFRDAQSSEPRFAAVLELDLTTIEPCVAGPKRPQDRVAVSQLREAWQRSLRAPTEQRGFGLSEAQTQQRATVSYPDGRSATLTHGSVVIAAITSCTNTSNPAVLLAAGLLAKKAVEAGLSVGPTVKTSLAPGSRVVTDYLDQTGLSPYLDALGFHTVGYGCTTCIGNSGPLPEPVVAAIEQGKLVVASVLSGNRNFEGRINPQTRANYLASPPLVVAYALAGTVDIDLEHEPLGYGREGQRVYLRDLWPTPAEIAALLDAALDPEVFRRCYDGIDQANPQWNAIPVGGGTLYAWDEASSYIQQPPFFLEMAAEPPPIAPITGARLLALLGDSVTTDHISPAGSIGKSTPAGSYLLQHGVAHQDFNSYGARRGNDRVMTRGTFANIRLRNQLAPGTEGGFTTHFPSGEVLTIFEAAQRYRYAGVPTIVVAGLDYGMGSSRDWAAKGTYLLGVRAVIARSFERIHRSNLVGMGVLPLELVGDDAEVALGLSGRELLSIAVGDDLRPRQRVRVEVRAEDGSVHGFETLCRIDTPIEIDYYRNGGILHTVLRQLLRPR